MVRDYSVNIRPLLRLFYVFAILPFFFIITLLGLHRYFVNTFTAVWAWRGRNRWRFLAISASKPGDSFEGAKTK